MIEEKTVTDDWQARIEAVMTAVRKLQTKYGDSHASATLAEYVNDPKWEVRQAVADTIPLVAESYLPLFIPLCRDANYYVAASATRGMERRSIIVKDTQKKQKRREVLFQNSEKIRRKYGAEVAELARKDAEQAYSMMVGQVAHDIRTLLTPIKYWVQRLPYLTEGKLPLTEMQEMRIASVELQEHVDMMERLSEDVLTLVRQTPEKRTAEKIHELLHHACNDVRSYFTTKKKDISGIEVNIKISQDLTCRVVRDLMIRVFTNLLKNAFESFTDGDGEFVRSGKIDVIGECVDSGVKIKICDTGKGISKEDLKLVQQFKLYRTLKNNGTGFGLAIAYEKIQDHKGTLTIESVKNEGTVVTVFLPDKESQK